MNVLLIEPDQVLGGAIKTGLERAGLEVWWRRRAQSALDALDEHVPDLIVLEVQLGVHNGIEFLYEIRSYEEWQQLPVIIHTLNPQLKEPTFQAAIKQLGVEHVLYKPQTSMKQLIQAIAQTVTS